MKRIDYTYHPCYNNENRCYRWDGKRNMKWRLKKKKGLLPDPAYEKVRERWMQELEAEMDRLGKMEKPETEVMIHRRTQM